MVREWKEIRSANITLVGWSVIGAVGSQTSLLSSVSKTATPASTLPTVNETSIVMFEVMGPCVMVGSIQLRHLADTAWTSKLWPKHNTRV